MAGFHLGIGGGLCLGGWGRGGGGFRRGGGSLGYPPFCAPLRLCGEGGFVLIL